MVGLPNRAARCGICKRHKIKCDLLHPACSRCKRLNLSCEYPDLQRGQIFINRNIENPETKTIDVLSNTSTERRTKPKTQQITNHTHVTSAPASFYGIWNNAIPQTLSEEAVNRLPLLSSFLDVYLPKVNVATICGQTQASWINPLHSVNNTNKFYDWSLKALCMAQIGLWNEKPDLVKDSHRLYGWALRGLREALSHPKSEAPEATLATTLLLSTYELFSSSSENGQGWVSHVRGGSWILRSIDRNVFSSPVGSLLCPRIRTIHILESIQSRKTSPLTGLHFNSSVENGTIDINGQLQDLMIQIPGLLETFDSLALAQLHEISRRTALPSLLQRCSRLEVQLLAWCEVLREQVSGPLYSSIDPVAQNPIDSSGTRTFPRAFQFPSLNIAQLLLLYWSALIILYRTIQDIDKRITEIQVKTGKRRNLSNSPLQDSDFESDLGFSQHPNHSISSTVHIASLANKICQSFEYCYKGTNGTFGIQSTVFPRWVATDFYASIPEYHREWAWCQEVDNLTAPGSRFDLRVMKFRCRVEC
ncbi:hypothetical protein NA56DRAFT_756693 [Hyaloscypha hepaticicola]|uniref:Zn(2)-C6 fungal-type domain-containing protein n=1 Tax=Hyaloscypha hepaticicola TaxID=2082293 RepID=A0A2J6PE63_9HELO|nr:hypothetical protein NA56DRAFT_756693 [Hyaloscypha hepaticicola]